VAGANHRQVDGGAVPALRKLALQRPDLMDQLHGGIATVLRRHARVRRAPPDLDDDIPGTLAPDGECIRRVSRLHVEFDIALPCQTLDQLGGARRAQLLAAVQHESDRGVVLESELMQDPERGDGIDVAAFLIAHAGPIGAVACDTEGPLRHGAGAEHGVDVSDDEYPGLAVAVKYGDQIRGYAADF